MRSDPRPADRGDAVIFQRPAELFGDPRQRLLDVLPVLPGIAAADGETDMEGERLVIVDRRGGVTDQLVG